MKIHHSLKWTSIAAALALIALPSIAEAGGGYSKGTSDEQAGKSAQQQSSEQFSSNPDIVKEAQSALKDRGYDVGKADGTFGKKTRTALKKFQKAQGLESTGQLDQQTLSALGVDTSGEMAGQEGGEYGQMGDEPMATPTPMDQPGQVDGMSDDMSGQSGDSETAFPGTSDSGESISD